MDINEDKEPTEFLLSNFRVGLFIYASVPHIHTHFNINRLVRCVSMNKVDVGFHQRSGLGSKWIFFLSSSLLIY